MKICMLQLAKIIHLMEMKITSIENLNSKEEVSSGKENMQSTQRLRDYNSSVCARKDVGLMPKECSKGGKAQQLKVTYVKKNHKY